VKEHIKYCPRCASQDLDFTGYSGDGLVLCLTCRTQFLVQAVRLDLPGSRQLTLPALEAYALDSEP